MLSHLFFPTAKPKMSLKSIRLKTSDSDRPGGEGEGVVKDREEAAKKKRRKKKKSGESVGGGGGGGEKEGAGKGERETLKDRAKSEQLDVTTTAAPEVAEREKVESEGAASGGSSPSSAADSGIGSGVEHVAVETPARQAGIDKSGGDTPPVVGERETRRRKLHTCACCGVGETTAKTFKRCQKSVATVVIATPGVDKAVMSAPPPEWSSGVMAAHEALNLEIQVQILAGPKPFSAAHYFSPSLPSLPPPFTAS